MKDLNDVIALKLKKIDLSKIPAFNYVNNGKRIKINRVFLYISELKRFVCIDLKQLRRKNINVNTIMMQNNIELFNVFEDIYYYFYNIDEFKDDYPCSAIEIFEKQNNVYYNSQQTDKLLMKYAWLYQKYNIMEQLVKSGFSDLIYSLIFRNSMNHYVIENIFNVDGKNICDITGLKKAYVQILRDNIKSIDLFVETKDFLKKHPVSPQQLNRFISLVKSNNRIIVNTDSTIQVSLSIIDDLLSIEFNNRHLYTFSTLLNYIEKQSVEQGYNQMRIFLSTLLDYIKMCIDLNIMPDIKTKNLQREHNITVVQYNQLEDEQANKKYNKEFDKQYQKLKQYEYHDSRLEVIAPKTPKDIIEEGRNNHNCVGSYVESHASGKSYIFFIRKLDNLEKSYITVELDNNLSKVKQAFYSYNKELNTTDNTFIKNWMKEIVTRRSINEQSSAL